MDHLRTMPLLTELPMVDMLLSAMDMPLLNMDMDRPLPECPMVDMLLLTRGYASLNSGQQHHEQGMNTNTQDWSLLLQGEKLLEAQT